MRAKRAQCLFRQIYTLISLAPTLVTFHGEVSSILDTVLGINGINETLMKRRGYSAICTTCPNLPLGNDLRTVLHDQNHMLLLCTPSAVLVAKQANHVSERKYGRRRELYLS